MNDINLNLPVNSKIIIDQMYNWKKLHKIIQEFYTAHFGNLSELCKTNHTLNAFRAKWETLCGLRVSEGFPGARITIESLASNLKNYNALTDGAGYKGYINEIIDNYKIIHEIYKESRKKRKEEEISVKLETIGISATVILTRVNGLFYNCDIAMEELITGLKMNNHSL